MQLLNLSRKSLGRSETVTDDFAIYRTLAENLGSESQVCQFQMRVWAGRRPKAWRLTVLKGWLSVIDEVQNLLAECLPEGSKRLFELWKQIPERKAWRDEPVAPSDQFRYLLIYAYRTDAG